MSARTQEVWISTDDRGVKRRAIVDYDERDNALVSRELMHEVLTLAGLRLSMDADAS